MNINRGFHMLISKDIVVFAGQLTSYGLSFIS